MQNCNYLKTIWFPQLCSRQKSKGRQGAVVLPLRNFEGEEYSPVSFGVQNTGNVASK